MRRWHFERERELLLLLQNVSVVLEQLRAARESLNNIEEKLSLDLDL